MLHKLHPGDTPEQFELEFLVSRNDGLAWGWVISFVHSQQVVRLLSSLLSHTKWKCQQWRRAACFFRSFQRWELAVSFSLSIPFVTDYSSSLLEAAIAAQNSCTAQTQTPSAVQIQEIKLHWIALRIPQPTSHLFNYKNNLTPVCRCVQLWRHTQQHSICRCNM